MDWRTLPPVSRTLTAACVVTTIGVLFGFIPFSLLPFNAKKVVPQLWRVFTPFLFTKPDILQMMWECHAFYQYCSRCEALFAGPADFIVFLAFCCLTVLWLVDPGSIEDKRAGFVTGWINTFADPSRLPRENGLNRQVLGFFTGLNEMSLNSTVLNRALVGAFSYYWAIQHPHGVSGFFFFTIPNKYVPYALMVVEWLMQGSVFVMLMGVLAAHAYLFLTHVYPRYTNRDSPLKTPQWLRALFTPSPLGPGAGGVQNPGGARPNTARATGSSTGFAGFGSSSIWSGQRGRRLGDS